MVHVFISYAHADVDFVASLIQRLGSSGIECWVDNEKLRAGKDWRSGIDDAIENAFATIAVMTPAAKASEYVTYEWAYALGAKKTVIPLMLKPTELHPRLEALQYLDFSDFNARPWDKLIAHLEELKGEFGDSVISVPNNAPPAVKQAAIALDSHDPDEREIAIESLAQMSHPVALQVLTGAVQHPTRDVRVKAAFRLAELTHYQNSEAVPGLLDALKDANYKIACQAADALGRIGDESAVPDLLDRIYSEEGRVRRAVSRALVRFGGTVIPALLDILEDRDQRMREIAAWSLGEIKDPSANAGLVAILGDRDAGVIRAANEALVKIARRRSTAEYYAAVSSDDPEEQEPTGFRGNVPLELCEALQSDKWNIRVNAAKTVGDIGDLDTVPVLTGMLGDEYWEVREAASRALERIGTPEALEAVEKWRQQNQDGQQA